MPIIKDKWKEVVNKAFIDSGFMSPNFSGKFLVTVMAGNIVAVEISQTIK